MSAGFPRINEMPAVIERPTTDALLHPTVVKNLDKKAAVIADKPNFSAPKVFISGRPNTCNT